MFKAFTSYIAEGWKIKTDKGEPTYDGIQVRSRPTSSGENEYLIGNGSLHEYESRDPAYGEKILKHILTANRTMETSNKNFLSEYKGVEPISLNPATKIILTQKQFGAFAAAASASAPAPASAAAAPPEPEPTFALENGPIGSRKMLLYFKGTPRDFKMGKSLVIDVPVGPKSPISKLIFFDNASEITIEYVLKPDAMSYCAMARYDTVNQFAPTRDGELKHEFPPSITKELHLLKKGEKEELDTQIRTMIAKIESYANDCAAEKDVMDNGRAYYTGVRSAHVPDPIKRRILGLFGRPSSPVVDDLAGRMSEVTPMGGVARPPSSSSSDL
jgi:hypothetical protein